MFTPSLFTEDLDHVLAHTRDLWEEVRGQRLFITGGTGFFGMWLVESFLWANEKLDLGARAVVLSRDPAAFCRKMPHLAALPALSFHQGDVRTFDYPEGTFAHVLHAVNQTAADSAHPPRLLDVMARGARHVLDFAVHCQAQKFLFTSSGSVYGPLPPDIPQVSEDYPGSPDTMDARFAHGHGKRFCEQLCAAYAQEYGFEAKIARAFAFVGPYLPLDANYAAGNFIRDALQGGPIVVLGDGTPYRSYLYAADLAIWLWTILFRGRTCRPYNVGSGNCLTIADLAHAVAGLVRPGAEVQIAKEPVPARPADRYVPAVRRAESELGLQQTTDLPEALRRTVSWYSERQHC